MNLKLKSQPQVIQLIDSQVLLLATLLHQKDVALARIKLDR